MTYERAHLKAMHGYTPGQQPDTPAIKLNTNENPYPPGPAVAHALSSFPLNMLQRYPDPLAGAFRASVARLHRLAPANVIATNGGDELLRLALTTFLDPGKPLGLLTPSYSLYSVLATIHGSPLASVPLGNDWSVPDNTAERWNAAGVPLAIMTNPHAPSGTLASAAGLHKLALAFRGVLLVDEAYVDFVDPEIGHETSTMVAAYPNVLLLRTLSKGYSLAGLRLAYGLGAAELVAPMLSKTKDSYNVDAIAQAVGAAALEDVRSAARLVSYARHRRRIFSSRLFPPAGDGTARRKSIGLSWPDASLCDGSMRRDYGINYGSASVRLRKTSTLWKLSGCLADRSRFQNHRNSPLEGLAAHFPHPSGSSATL